MATLQQIYVNLISGCFMGTFSFGLFGLAVRFGYNNQIAPRSWSRPQAILKNVLKVPYAFQWLSWSMKMSYPDLMGGIPGTGTRSDGWTGPKLKVNLDGIIMLKYHVLLLKVALLASLLCLIVVLPITTTAECDPILLGTGTCMTTDQLTDFEVTTIAHIPPLRYNGTNASARENFSNVKKFWVGDISSRYFGIALVALIIYWYTCHLVWKEWIENLALRRVYFLEHDHYAERLNELNEIQAINVSKDPMQATHLPWLPHPELRETVPNVSLYSCLYQLPRKITTVDLPDTATDLQRQIAATVNFFNLCVPNQPGFSSSVAAVTILPEPAHVAQAWKKWYYCGKKLTQLRYLRSLIQMHLERQNAQDEEWVTDEEAPKEEKHIDQMHPQDCIEETAAVVIIDETLPLLDEMSEVQEETPDSEMLRDSQEISSHNISTTRSRDGDRLSVFKYSNFDSDHFARSIGLEEETKLKNMVSGIDIEQLSVYAREYAQSSSNACPQGCGEKIIRFSSLEQLRRLEQEAVEKVKQANAELVDARNSVKRWISNIDAEQNDEVSNHTSEAKKDDGLRVMSIEEGKSQESQALPHSLRQRRIKSSKNQWEQAQCLAASISGYPNGNTSFRCCGTSGSCTKGDGVILTSATNVKRSFLGSDEAKFTLKQVVSILEHPTYAVVTFTSRQAAVAARQCLVDGSGLDRWIEIEELPVAPLADAVPWDIFQCRGCCRPVSLTISEREKKIRRFLGICMFLFFCFCYTIPLAATSQLLNPAKLAAAFPDSEALQDPDSFFFRILSGISSGFLYTIFFSFCPQLFKAIANFEGNVSSKRTAEDKALTYFWYFMMLTAFTGTALTQMLAEIFINSASLATELKDVLIEVANSIPTQQAPVWMNWIVVRFSYTLPFLYLFQANTFGFNIINWPWCSRLMRGGGPGGPPPYRIFVDSGTAFMCVVAISPVCPLIAPLSFIYFSIILLMLRWLLVFVYRPWYDTGGNKWPALHEIIISSTIFGQVLLTTILGLRNALFPASLIVVSIIPTYLFSRNCKDKFLRSYNDAGLLQTSQLDGWEDGVRLSNIDREEYRRWLVDCHKASYVPVCLADSEAVSTVEPAVVTALQHDEVDHVFA